MKISSVFFCLLISLLLLCQSSYANAIDDVSLVDEHVIRFPRVKDAALYQDQADYYFKLLKLAIERADIQYKLEIVTIPTMPQSRSLMNIKQNVYDVHWGVTSKDRESMLRPIRIPLLKGLLGLRIALVSAQSKDVVSQITHLEDFKNVYFGQGHDWIDTKIFKHHGLRVIESANTQSLHELLNKRRIDLLPRSILEVWYEAEHMQHKNVSVDTNIAIYYPLPTYFFVRNDETVMHQQLKLGLERAILDGSFQFLFNQYFEDDIQKAKLKSRRFFRFDNPYLPEKTPLNDQSLWFEIPLN